MWQAKERGAQGSSLLRLTGFGNSKRRGESTVEKTMSTEEETAGAEQTSTKRTRFAQLRQAGFVDVDKWWMFSEGQQQLLLGVLRNDPRATVL